MLSNKQLRWDRHFLNLALEHAKMSKDPSTKVGAVIAGPDLELRSAGFNGFPRYIRDLPERLSDRDLKLKLMVHAELNAILGAARVGTPLKGCTIYIVPVGTDGHLWGGPPCTRCTTSIIQSGISEVVSYPIAYDNSRWAEDAGSVGLALHLLKESGVAYREVTPEVLPEGNK